jgi:predicted amidohydrolase
MAGMEKIAVSRAVENRIYVMLVNMVGEDPGKKMAGRSMLISPDGEVLERFSDSTDLREIRLEDDFLDAVAGRKLIPEPVLKG